jgi:hypothetical protein
MKGIPRTIRNGESGTKAITRMRNTKKHLSPEVDLYQP